MEYHVRPRTSSLTKPYGPPLFLHFRVRAYARTRVCRALSIKSEEKIIGESKTKATIQLDRMKFKQFDGDIRRYPRFKEDFNTHIKPLCDVKQLPFVLISYLCQELSDDVDSLGDDINEIWAR